MSTESLYQLVLDTAERVAERVVSDRMPQMIDSAFEEHRFADKMRKFQEQKFARSIEDSLPGSAFAGAGRGNNDGATGLGIVPLTQAVDCLEQKIDLFFKAFDTLFERLGVGYSDVFHDGSLHSSGAGTPVGSSVAEPSDTVAGVDERGAGEDGSASPAPSLADYPLGDWKEQLEVKL